MTNNNINLEKVQEIKTKVESHLVGINQITTLRTNIEKALGEIIEPSKAKQVLDNNTIDNLESEELIALLRVIYSQLHDETFNPKNLVIEDEASKPTGMYNSEFKERFLDEHRVTVNGKEKPYSDETKRVAKILFKKVSKVEDDYKKDIYEFSPSQFEDALKELKASTIRSLQNSISTLEQYIGFTIQRINSKNQNVATLYNNKKTIENFLNKNAEENMYFSKLDINALAEGAENAQDGVILDLIFDGVSYKNNFLELRSIQLNHVNFDKMVINIPKLHDEETGEVFEPREVPISASTARMIKKAMDFEEKYVSLTGNSSRRYKIAQSDYILRGLRDNYQIKWENVGQRILRIAEIAGAKNYLTATNISYSGQVYYAMELMKESVSEDEAIAEIIKRFALSDNVANYHYLKNRLEIARKVLDY